MKKKKLKINILQLYFYFYLVMTDKKKSNRKLYPRYKYNLADGACVMHIPSYVNDPTALFAELKSNINWKKFKYKVHGRQVLSPRLMKIMQLDVDDDRLPLLFAIKKRLERITGLEFSYVVLNYYRDGNDYIGYHSDREVGVGQSVVSVSLGAERRFNLKHKYRTDVKHTFMLGDGDVLILNNTAIKTMYKHSVPKMANVGARISLTFRE